MAYVYPWKVVLEGIIYASNKADLGRQIKELSVYLSFEGAKLKLVSAEKENQ